MILKRDISVADPHFEDAVGVQCCPIDGLTRLQNLDKVAVCQFLPRVLASKPRHRQRGQHQSQHEIPKPIAGWRNLLRSARQQGWLRSRGRGRRMIGIRHGCSGFARRLGRKSLSMVECMAHCGTGSTATMNERNYCTSVALAARANSAT